MVKDAALIARLFLCKVVLVRLHISLNNGIGELSTHFSQVSMTVYLSLYWGHPSFPEHAHRQWLWLCWGYPSQSEGLAIWLPLLHLTRRLNHHPHLAEVVIQSFTTKANRQKL